MFLCKHNPKQLIRSHYFIPRLMEQAGKQNIYGDSALIKLFASEQANIIDSMHKPIRVLLERESNIRSNNGLTALMSLCKNNP